MNQEELLMRIAGLESELRQKNEQIAYLECLSDAHNNIILLANEERIEAEKQLHAHENIHGISRIFSGESEPHTATSTAIWSQTADSLRNEGVVLTKALDSLSKALGFCRIVIFARDRDRLKTLLAHGRVSASLQENGGLELISQCVAQKKTTSRTVAGRPAQIVLPVIDRGMIIGAVYGEISDQKDD